MGSGASSKYKEDGEESNSDAGSTAGGKRFGSKDNSRFGSKDRAAPSEPVVPRRGSLRSDSIKRQMPKRQTHDGTNLARVSVTEDDELQEGTKDFQAEQRALVRRHSLPSVAISEAMLLEQEEELPETLEESLQELYPGDEYHMTMYANLGGARIGTRVTLQDFTKPKTLNGISGVCKECNAVLRVWIFEADDGRKVRVIPPRLMPPQKPLLPVHRFPVGNALYGKDQLVQIVVDPAFCRTAELPSKLNSSVTDTSPLMREADNAEQVLKRGPSIRRQGSTIDAASDLTDPMQGFKVGVRVRIKDQSSKHDAGEGIIVGKGNKPGVLLIQFAEGSMCLPAARLENLDAEPEAAKAKRPMRRRSTVR